MEMTYYCTGTKEKDITILVGMMKSMDIDDGIRVYDFGRNEFTLDICCDDDTDIRIFAIDEYGERFMPGDVYQSDYIVDYNATEMQRELKYIWDMELDKDGYPIW